MKRCLAVLFLIGFLATAAFAAGPKEYQVTGPVLEVKDDAVIIAKGKEKWEIALDKVTKVTGGDLKVGSKVTVYYTMKAASIEVKGQKEKPEVKKEGTKKK